MIFEELSDSDRKLALERYQILRPFLEEGVSATAIAASQEITARTVRNWSKQYKKDGLAGLVRKSRSDRNKRRVCDEKIVHAIEGLVLRRPPLSAAAIHRIVSDIAQEMEIATPSYDTVYDVINRIEPAIVTLAREGTDTYKKTFDLVRRREAARPNEIWQADHTELDVLISAGGKESRKPWLTIIEDDYSRAVAGYALSFSEPSAHQTALALRHAIRQKDQPGWSTFGIPEILYTDHGSDFTSRHIEEVAAQLKIRMIFSTVGQPRGRGKLERFFRSVQQKCLCHLDCYAPGRTKPKAIYSMAQLAQALERHLIAYNNARHSQTRIAPQLRWEEGGFLPQLPECWETLDLLLQTVPKPRRVRIDGIHFETRIYTSTTLQGYVGKDVVIRYDPRDVTDIRVYHNNRFICRAICHELAGESISQREFTRTRNARRKELQRQIRDRNRAVDDLLASRSGRAYEDVPEPAAPPAPQSTIRLKSFYSD